MKHVFAVLFIGLFSTTAFGQWQWGFEDLSGNSPGGGSGLAFGVHDSILFYSFSEVNGNEGVWRHYDTGSHPWVEADYGIDFSQGTIVSFASLGSKLFANFLAGSLGYGPAYVTSNLGAGWKVAIAAPVASNGRYLFAEYYDYLVRSADSGGTWDSIAKFSLKTWATDGVCVLASAADGIYKSTNSGIGWSKEADTPSGLSLSAFAILGTQLYAGGTAVFRSTDSGASWKAVTTPPLGYTLSPIWTRGSVNALASYGHYLFAGTDSGVYLSSDSGGSWRRVSEGMGGGTFSYALHFPAVKLLAVLDTTLWAGVYTGTDATGNRYGYVAQRPISEMIKDTTAGVVQAKLPGDTIDVYPNPATGLVTIRSGGTSILGVQVLNVLGEKVLNAPSEHASALTLDLSKLASGTYFLEIVTPSGTVLRKVIRE
jgi:Secretion system C-terminal sorting domain